MKIFIGFVAATSLSACVTETTPEGCPVMLSEIGRAQTEACQRAYYEERARLTGGSITRCFNTSSGMTCVQE